jgi:hypothetical protein
MGLVGFDGGHQIEQKQSSTCVKEDWKREDRSYGLWSRFMLGDLVKSKLKKKCFQL